MNPREHADLCKHMKDRAAAITVSLKQHVLDRGRLAIVKAPPGSGKTHLLLEAVAAAYRAGMRVAVATQTNSQADSACERLARQHRTTPAIRFAAANASAIDLGPSISWATSSRALPSSRCVVVGTAAKWGLVDIELPFDVLFIEEAWQLSWADFMLLGQVAERFVMIGDPGQIPPVVTVDVSRWQTSPRGPHLAAPSVILQENTLPCEKWDLPATWRLPNDSVDLVRPFYDFEFGAYSALGERAVLAEQGGSNAEDRVIGLLATGSAAALTIPTVDAGPPLDGDIELARAAARLVKRLLARRAAVRKGRSTSPLTAAQIGLVSTHRVMNTQLDLELAKSLRGVVRVDTPERWQGLEREVMIVVHPLSGVERPSEFDLETGRLCVMASRHMAGIIVLSRDHVGDTLRSVIPSATQPLGRPDVSGRGLFSNLRFWERLETDGRVIAGK